MLSYIFYSIGYLIFIFGYLNIQNVQKETSVSKVNLVDHSSEVPRVVFVVIDALRFDMIASNSSSMPFLTAANKQIFRTVAQPPTVTLPRVKALTTGTIPDFIDVIMNFNTPKLTIDNIVKQWNSANRSVYFFGDDTWLKLFPDSFSRSEGTVSFFASDFYEVDTNVTRHLSNVFKFQEHWDVLILHYLGLDHIGHIHGPFGHLVDRKLREMDDVLQSIANNMAAGGSNWVMMLTSDHGMADYGGHGGSSYSEINTPFVVMSGRHSYTSQIHELQQVDISTILALLTNVNIPKDSLGRFPQALYHHFEDSLQLLKSLHRNARQLYENHNNNGAEESSFSDVHRKYHSILTDCVSVKTSTCEQTMREVLYQQEDFLAVKQKRLIQNAKTFDMPSILCGISIMIIIYLHTLTRYITSCEASVPSLRRLRMSSIPLPRTLIEWTLLFGLTFQTISLLSSSFVEEEHQTWYCLSVTLDLLIVLRSVNRGSTWLALSALLLTMEKMLRCVHQVGDKWSHLPDLCQLLTGEAWKPVFLLSLCAALALIFALQPHKSIFTALTALLLLLFQLSNNSVVPTLANHSWAVRSARLGAMSIFADLFYRRFRLNVSNSSSVATFLLHTCLFLTKPCNLLVWGAGVLKLCCIRALSQHHRMSAACETALYYVHGMAFFFQMGNSNNLATVDVSPGFVGQHSYNQLLTGLLIGINLFSGPAYWLLMAPKYSGLQSQKHHRLMFLMIASPSLLYTVICVHLRHHLFVWTVFVPKLIYLISFYFIITFVFFYKQLFQ